MTDVNEFMSSICPPVPDWMNDTARELLTKAEERYLDRDKSYEFIGVVTDPDGPQIRFGALNRKQIYIEIHPDSLDFPDQAIYQIAHEVIHLLAPNHNPPTTLFEEGLATWFSIFVPTFPWDGYRAAAEAHVRTEPGASNYRRALEIFEEAQGVDPDVVRKLRTKQPLLCNVRPDDIIGVAPAISQRLAEKMCERIQMR